MAFISNTVAHAIDKGYIDGPDKISAWVTGCVNAIDSVIETIAKREADSP